jgi:hypothetical protein
MPAVTVAVVAALVLMVYLLAGAIGLLCTTLSSTARLQGPPKELRDVDGFWHAFRIGLKAMVTWPWTWKRWTDG